MGIMASDDKPGAGRSADDVRYRSGSMCGTPGCENGAGTFYSRWYCPACDAQRRFAIEHKLGRKPNPGDPD